MPVTDQALTLSQMQERIRAAVEENAGGAQWVVAEISEMKVNFSGHCYLELTERDPAGKAPVAQARATIWVNKYKLIARYFRTVTGSDLASGMKVMLLCTPAYHPVYGLSLSVSDIDPAYTLGETELQRQQTIARLREEGVFDMNRECTDLTLVPQRLAVVSSPQAAGFQDFCREIGASPFLFEIELFAAAMQGTQAEGDIIAALEAIAGREEEFDAVALIRGGGSQGDLGGFDSYLLCAHIAQFPLPVVTGIGHDKDVSVADLVAHTSLKTPTAVAGFFVDRAAEVWAVIGGLEGEIIESARRTLVQEGLRIENASRLLASRAQAALNLNRIELLGEQVRTAARAAIERRTAQVELLGARVEGLSPRRILERGYAFVRGVRSIADAPVGSAITVELADGRLGAEVTSIEELAR